MKERESRKYHSHLSLHSQISKKDLQKIVRSLFSETKPPQPKKTRKQKNVFTRFEDDIKLRRLRESFYENLRQHVPHYDQESNSIVVVEPTSTQALTEH